MAGIQLVAQARRCHLADLGEGNLDLLLALRLRRDLLCSRGQVIVTPDGGAPLHMGKGDLAIFPAGMSCTWDILQPLRKHYCFT